MLNQPCLQFSQSIFAVKQICVLKHSRYSRHKYCRSANTAVKMFEKQILVWLGFIWKHICCQTNLDSQTLHTVDTKCSVSSNASAVILTLNVPKKPKKEDQGPVAQSFVSLTSLLRGQLVKCFMTL